VHAVQLFLEAILYSSNIASPIDSSVDLINSVHPETLTLAN